MDEAKPTLANVLAGNNVPTKSALPPYWGDVQWRGPFNLIPLPQKDSPAAHSIMDLLNYLAMAVPGRSVRGATSGNVAPNALGEWPTRAAVRIGERTFTADSHFAAIEKAQAALGNDALARAGSAVATDGFLTSAGRYVSREEAGRMLDALNQTRHYKTWLGNDKKGKAGLLSEALELYDPKTGRDR